MCSDIEYSDIWNTILKLHWNYVYSDKSLEKIKEKHDLENCIRNHLSVEEHNKKFFLPVVPDILALTILNSDTFDIYKAKTAFERISQYANNLICYPWRKEFRIIKTYSGVYQHDIKNSLIYAEKLFIEMGYIQKEDGSFVFKDPICIDQVWNVSRDCMTACVECDIMIEIFSKILNNEMMKPTWNDILMIREKYTGGISQSVKKYVRNLQRPDDHFYNSIRPQTVSKYSRTQNRDDYGASQFACTPHNNVLIDHPPIPQSKSFEHYNQNGYSMSPYNGVQRHSFDQQHNTYAYPDSYNNGTNGHRCYNQGYANSHSQNMYCTRPDMYQPSLSKHTCHMVPHNLGPYQYSAESENPYYNDCHTAYNSGHNSNCVYPPTTDEQGSSDFLYRLRPNRTGSHVDLETDDTDNYLLTNSSQRNRSNKFDNKNVDHQFPSRPTTSASDSYDDVGLRNATSNSERWIKSQKFQCHRDGPDNYISTTNETNDFRRNKPVIVDIGGKMSRKNEWQCEFCSTFNKNNLKICNMCAKTNGIHLQSKNIKT